MRKRVKTYGMVLIAVMFLLTGCGNQISNQIPNMTDEEAEMIVNYAVGLLMKYDANKNSRLVDLTEITTQEVKETEPLTTEEAPSGMLPVEDTPIKEKDNVAKLSLEEVLGMPEGVTVTFLEDNIMDSYPQVNGGEEVYSSIDAVNGKKLLVLSFQIDNQSQTEQQIDIFSKNPKFKVLSNNMSKRTLITLLTDDLSTYVDTIPSGENRKVVLVVEVEESITENITSLLLYAESDAKSTTIQFK